MLHMRVMSDHWSTFVDAMTRMQALGGIGLDTSSGIIKLGARQGECGVPLVQSRNNKRANVTSSCLLASTEDEGIRVRWTLLQGFCVVGTPSRLPWASRRRPDSPGKFQFTSAIHLHSPASVKRALFKAVDLAPSSIDHSVDIQRCLSTFLSC